MSIGNASRLHWALKWIAVIAATASAISFAQHTFQIGIAAALGAVIDFYRSIAHPIVALIPSLLGLTLASWYQDAVAVSGLSSGLFFKAVDAGVPQIGDKGPALIVPSVLALLMAYSLFGILLLILTPVVMFARAPGDPAHPLAKNVRTSDIARAAREHAVLCAIVIAACVLFFAVNYLLYRT